jgi:hypothetical protein
MTAKTLARFAESFDYAMWITRADSASPWSRIPARTIERYIECPQYFREAVNDRFQISLANNAP